MTSKNPDSEKTYIISELSNSKHSAAPSEDKPEEEPFRDTADGGEVGRGEEPTEKLCGGDDAMEFDPVKPIAVAWCENLNAIACASETCARIPSCSANPPFWIPIHIDVPEQPTASPVFNIIADSPVDSVQFIEWSPCPRAFWIANFHGRVTIWGQPSQEHAKVVRDAFLWKKEHEWRQDTAVVIRWLSGVSPYGWLSAKSTSSSSLIPTFEENFLSQWPRTSGQYMSPYDPDEGPLITGWRVQYWGSCLKLVVLHQIFGNPTFSFGGQTKVNKSIARTEDFKSEETCGSGVSTANCYNRSDSAVEKSKSVTLEPFDMPSDVRCLAHTVDCAHSGEVDADFHSLPSIQYRQQYGPADPVKIEEASGAQAKPKSRRTPSILRVLVLFLLFALPIVPCASAHATRSIPMDKKLGDPSDFDSVSPGPAASPDLHSTSDPSDIGCNTDVSPPPCVPSASLFSPTTRIRRRSDSGFDIQLRGEYEIHWGLSPLCIIGMVASLFGLQALLFGWYSLLAYLFGKANLFGKATGKGPGDRF